MTPILSGALIFVIVMFAGLALIWLLVAMRHYSSSSSTDSRTTTTVW